MHGGIGLLFDKILSMCSRTATQLDLRDCRDYEPSRILHMIIKVGGFSPNPNPTRTESRVLLQSAYRCIGGTNLGFSTDRGPG